MDKRTSKIAAFIESLPMDVSVGNCESTLLATNMEFIGGGKVNGGSCINDDEDLCFDAKNEGACKNFGGFCDEATNKKSCLSTNMTYKEYLDFNIKDKP